jgi:hypothetical protein
MLNAFIVNWTMRVTDWLRKTIELSGCQLQVAVRTMPLSRRSGARNERP